MAQGCLGRPATCCCCVVALRCTEAGCQTCPVVPLLRCQLQEAGQPAFAPCPGLTLTPDRLLQARCVCWATGQDCTRLRFHCLLRPDIDLSPQAFADGKLPPGLLAQHFVRLDQAEIQVRHSSTTASALHEGRLGLLSTKSGCAWTRLGPCTAALSALFVECANHSAIQQALHAAACHQVAMFARCQCLLQPCLDEVKTQLGDGGWPRLCWLWPPVL